MSLYVVRLRLIDMSLLNTLPAFSDLGFSHLSMISYCFIYHFLNLSHLLG